MPEHGWNEDECRARHAAVDKRIEELEHCSRDVTRDLRDIKWMLGLLIVTLAPQLVRAVQQLWGGGH